MERGASRIGLALVGAALAAGAIGWVPAAASAQKRVAVSTISGRGGAMVRAGVVRALRDSGDVEVVGADAVSRAAGRLGVDADDGRQPISAELGVAAWIEGEVERSRRRVAVTLSVINARDGSGLGVVSYEAKNPKLLGKRVERALWKDVRDLIAQAEAPEAEPEPEPIAEEIEEEPEPDAIAAVGEDEPAEDEDDDETAQEGDGGGEVGPSPLDVGVALAGFSRSFDYNDDLSGLRTYDLGLGPTVMLKVRWYPGAHFDDGIAANIGLELRGQFAFGIDSTLGDTSFPTSSRALGAGVRARLPIDAHELALLAGFANQSFAIDGARANGVEVDPGIPEASYTYLRLGAELRFAIGDSFAIGAAAAYLPALGLGELEDWFPRASGSGMEGELSLAHALSPSFELNAAFGLQRFAFSFDPRVEDVSMNRFIAGGAVDQYLYGTLGVRWLLGAK